MGAVIGTNLSHCLIPWCGETVRHRRPMRQGCRWVAGREASARDRRSVGPLDPPYKEGVPLSPALRTRDSAITDSSPASRVLPAVGRRLLPHVCALLHPLEADQREM